MIQRKDARTLLLLARAYKQMGNYQGFERVVKTLKATGSKDPRIEQLESNAGMTLAQVSP